MAAVSAVRGIGVDWTDPLARGLAGWWLFDEGTGRVVFDRSGNGLSARLEGNTCWAAGRLGFCVELNRLVEGDYVDCGTSAFGIETSNEFSISAWIYPFSSAVAGACIIRRHRYIKPFALYLERSPVSAVRFDVRTSTTGGVTTPSGTLELERWTHVVATRSADGVIKVYLDGREQISGVLTGVLDCSAASTYVGVVPTSLANYFPGRIANVRIYRRALSAEEVRRLYQEPFAALRVAGGFARWVQIGSVVSLSASISAAGSVSGQLRRERVVYLAATIGASSSVGGPTDVEREVSGKIRARGRVSGLLQRVGGGVVYGPELEWLKQVLFGAVTSAGVQLGLVLTRGWFWVRRAGCTVLYRGCHLDQVDFENPVAVVESDADQIRPADFVEHQAGQKYFYVVRRYNGCGYAERSLQASCRLWLDVDGSVVGPAPNRVFGLRGRQVEPEAVELVWLYCPLQQDLEPSWFGVYWNGGTGGVDYSQAVASVKYRGRRLYQVRLSVPGPGRYRFGVRAEDDTGAATSSLEELELEVTTSGSAGAVQVLGTERC